MDSVRSAALVARDLCTRREVVTKRTKDSVSRMFEDSLRDYDMSFDSVCLREAVRGCVMRTVLSLARVERICYTGKRIVRSSNRLGHKPQSESESDDD